MLPPCLPPGPDDPDSEKWSQSKCFEDLYYSQRKISYELARKLSEFKNGWFGSIHCQFNDCFIPLSWF